MAEPTTSAGFAGAALVLIASSIVGSDLGPLAVMGGGGLLGALLSVSEVETHGRLAALWYVARWSFAAVFVAGAVSLLAEKSVGLPAEELIGLVAFGFGYIGERWRTLLGAGVAMAARLMGARGKP